MADLPPYREREEGSGPSRAGTPSLAKVLAWTVPLVLLLLFVGLHLAGVFGPGH